MVIDAATPIVRADVLWRRSDRGVLVLVPGEFEVLSLRDTAAALWAALATPQRFGDAVQELADHYNVAASVIANDVSVAVIEFASRGVLRVG